MLAVQLALAVGPVVGWGLGDIRGFATNIVRLAVVGGAIVSCGLVASQPVVSDPFAAGVSAPSRSRSVLLSLGILSVPIVLGLLAYADRRGVFVTRDSVAIRTIGLLMYFGGESIRIVALRALGAQYSAFVTLQRQHALVETGIYRLIRHPIYLAQILVVPGMALAFRSMLAAPLLLISLLFVSKRIAAEEALLARTFSEFDRYRRHTWRLVPFVY